MLIFWLVKLGGAQYNPGGALPGFVLPSARKGADFHGLNAEEEQNEHLLINAGLDLCRPTRATTKVSSLVTGVLPFGELIPGDGCDYLNTDQAGGEWSLRR